MPPRPQADAVPSQGWRTLAGREHHNSHIDIEKVDPQHQEQMGDIACRYREMYEGGEQRLPVAEPHDPRRRVLCAVHELVSVYSCGNELPLTDDVEGLTDTITH